MKKILLVSIFILCLVSVNVQSEGLSDSVCPESSPLATKNGCYACDELKALKLINIEDNLKCPNRENVRDTWKNVSILKECPLEVPLKTVNGCQPCDTAYTFEIFSEKDNLACPNRDIKRHPYWINRLYSLQKKCPLDKPLRTDSECRSCFDSDFNIAIIDEKDCQVCSNRKASWISHSVGGSFGCLLDCPKEKPMLQKNSARCKTCNATDIDFSKEECDKCPNREFINDLCIFKKSPDKDKPLVVRKEYDVCFDGCPVRVEFKGCDIEESVHVRKSDCDKCPNRVYENGVCKLK